MLFLPQAEKQKSDSPVDCIIPTKKQSGVLMLTTSSQQLIKFLRSFTLTMFLLFLCFLNCIYMFFTAVFLWQRVCLSYPLVHFENFIPIFRARPLVLSVVNPYDPNDSADGDGDSDWSYWRQISVDTDHSTAVHVVGDLTWLHHWHWQMTLKMATAIHCREPDSVVR